MEQFKRFALLAKYDWIAALTRNTPMFVAECIRDVEIGGDVELIRQSYAGLLYTVLDTRTLITSDFIITLAQIFGLECQLDEAEVDERLEHYSKYVGPNEAAEAVYLYLMEEKEFRAHPAPFRALLLSKVLLSRGLGILYPKDVGYFESHSIHWMISTQRLEDTNIDLLCHRLHILGVGEDADAITYREDYLKRAEEISKYSLGLLDDTNTICDFSNCFYYTENVKNLLEGMKNPETAEDAINAVEELGVAQYALYVLAG